MIRNCFEIKGQSRCSEIQCLFTNDADVQNREEFQRFDRFTEGYFPSKNSSDAAAIPRYSSPKFSSVSTIFLLYYLTFDFYQLICFESYEEFKVNLNFISPSLSFISYILIILCSCIFQFHSSQRSHILTIIPITNTFLTFVFKIFASLSAESTFCNSIKNVSSFKTVDNSRNHQSCNVIKNVLQYAIIGRFFLNKIKTYPFLTV